MAANSAISRTIIKQILPYNNMKDRNPNTERKVTLNKKILTVSSATSPQLLCCEFSNDSEGTTDFHLFITACKQQGLI